MIHLSNVIHQITQLWNLMRFQLMSCEAVHLHFVLLSFPTSSSFIGYFQLGREIPVQEKPTIFKRTTSVIKPSKQGLKLVISTFTVTSEGIVNTFSNFKWVCMITYDCSVAKWITAPDNSNKSKGDQLCNTPGRQTRQKNKTNTFLLKDCSSCC